MTKLRTKIIKWLATNRLMSLPRKLVGKMVAHVVSSKNGALIFYDAPHNDKERAFGLIAKIKKETNMLISYLECHQIYLAVKKTKKIDGDIAEVGVYKGGSAKLICGTTQKPVYLFDTFEGLPEPSEFDKANQFRKGDYAASLEEVQNYLKNYPNAHFYKGLFPATAENIKNKKFSFVHLDVDIYQSTLDCLKFFYPRLNRGGIIISHDYDTMGGKKAFDEFFRDKPEIIIELPGCVQCLVVRTG